MLHSLAARRALVNSTALARRSYATTPASAVQPADGHPKPIHSSPAESSVKQERLTSLASIEASWAALPQQEQERIFEQLQEAQKKDWKELSLDEKKAAYYISYGPHGPRAPIVPPNTNGKVFMGVIGAIVAAFGAFTLVRTQAQETPKTLTKEWTDATSEYAKEQKMDPFTGASRPDGKGKTFTRG